MTPLDRVLPSFDAREVHVVGVATPPERALAAAKAVTVEETWLLRALFRLRGIRRSGPVLESLQRLGFELLVDESDAVVLAGVGRPWQPRGGARRVDDFAAFEEPGWAKTAIAFWADGQTIRTETRVLCTDDWSRRRFRRYWLGVRPFSGLTRRSWLRAVRRRASGGQVRD